MFGFFKNRAYRIRYLWNRLKEEAKDPHQAALGVALGVFIGFTPTIPFHTILAIILARVLNGSQIAAALGVWVSNPLTIPPLYWSSFKVGYWALGKAPPLLLPSDFSLVTLLKLGGEVAGVSLLGGIFLAFIPAVLCYIITFKAFKTFRSKMRSQPD